MAGSFPRHSFDRIDLELISLPDPLTRLQKGQCDEGTEPVWLSRVRGRMASDARHRPTGDGHRLAPPRLSVALDVEKPPTLGSTNEAGERRRPTD